jgi:flagellar hook-length control protein FliK
MPDVRKGARQQLIASGAQNGAGQPIGEQTATSLLSARNDTTPTATDTTQGKSFFTALKEFGENAAKAALSADTAKISAPAALPDATTLASLTQSAASSVSIAASPNVPVQAAVVTPVTHDGWGDEFNQKVTWLVTQHEQTAELHLNPPHLGPLDVVLNISGDQATALFTSPHAAVREAVEQALPKLREMLADNGITLGNATVNDQSPKEQQAWQADKQRGGNGGLSGQAGDAVPASSVALPVRRHLGMVDTFA